MPDPYRRQIGNRRQGLTRLGSIVLFATCSVLALSAAARESCQFTVRDERGAAVGRIDSKGDVRNSSGRLIGRITDGKVRDGRGAMIGRVDHNGSVRGRSGALMGKVEGDGKMRDASGALIGRISPDGTVRNRNGALRGRFDGFSSACQPVAAAYLFFFEQLHKQ
jgi:hypothetical protein